MNRVDRFAYNFNIFAAYLFLALIATWPLAAQFSTHLAGTDYLSVWNMWWVKYSIIDLHSNPLYTDHMFYPYKVHLLMNDLNLLNGLVSIPLQMVMPLSTAYNLIVLISYPVGAFGMYLLARDLTADRRAAFVAGAVFGFFPFSAMHIGIAPWIPYALLYIIRMFDGTGICPTSRRSARNAALAAMFTGFAFLSEYHSPILLGGFLVISTLYSAFMKRSGIPRQVIRFCLVCALFVAPVLGFAIKEYSAGAIRAEWILGPGAGLSGLISPPGIFSGWLPLSPVSLGAIAMVALGIRLYWRAERLILLLIVSIVISISLLPITTSAVTIIIPLIAALAAYGLKGRHWRISAVALMIVLVEFLPMHFVTVSAEIPGPYKMISADQDAHAVLEIPFSVRDDNKKTGVSDDARILYYQTAHAKRMPNGYLRHLAPERIFLSFLNFPVIRSLPYIEADMDPKLSVIEVDKTIAPETVDLLGLDYVILHRWYGHDDEEGANRYLRVREYLAYVLQMKTVYEDAGIAVFKTTRHEFNPMIIDLGNEDAIPYLMTNWINAQAALSTDYGWVAGNKAEMIVGLKKGGRYTASFFMRPQKLIADPAVTLYLNDTLIGRVTLGTEWTEDSFTLPSTAVKDGANRITFVPSATVLVPGNFRGPWTDASYFKSLSKRYVHDPSETRRPLDWEQDNSRFEGMPVSVALDAVRITRQAKDK